MTLTEASTKQWAQRMQNDLPCDPQGMRVINQQLWCCCGDACIRVFDSELQWQRTTLPAADMGTVYDVAEMSNGDVVIAAQRGLFCSSNGKL